MTRLSRGVSVNRFHGNDRRNAAQTSGSVLVCSREGTLDNHLPLDALCREIERSVLETLGVRELPERMVPVDGRLL